MSSDNINADKQSQSSVQFPQSISLAIRVLFPMSILLLSINYVIQTWGQIRMSNLHYPYLIITIMCALSLYTIFEEILKSRKEGKRSNMRKSLKDFANRWKSSIMFIFICVLYVIFIPVIGFFSASVAAMVSSIYVAGGRSYRISGITTTFIITLVWFATVMILGINLPGGIIDDLFI